MYKLTDFIDFWYGFEKMYWERLQAAVKVKHHNSKGLNVVWTILTKSVHRIKFFQVGKTDTHIETQIQLY